jgi:radical SAM superfamily enzyme YgiQ (UPF0313 family)
MKILLMLPPLFFIPKEEANLSADHLFSLFSYLKLNNSGVTVDVLDCGREMPVFTSTRQVAKFPKRFKKLLEKYSPDILGISCYTSMHYAAALKSAEIFKQENPAGIVIVGGYHPTAVPTDFSAPGLPFDYVVQGEGEVALSQLLKRALKPQPQAEVIQGVPLPLENEELLWGEYPYHQDGGRVIVFFSRGCPFGCHFCMEPHLRHLRPKRWRAYSSAKARKTVETILQHFKPRIIAIGDALFGAQPEWRRQFFRDLAEVAPDVPFWAETRVDTFSHADVRLIQNLRFRMDFGLDAIVPENILNQGKATQPQKYIEKFVALDDALNQHRLPHSVFLLYNFPGETPETYRQTRQRLREIAGQREYNYTLFSGQPFCLFPGTESYFKMREFEEKFGSLFPNDGWWRHIDRNPYDLANHIRASREMAGLKIDFMRENDELIRETLPDKKLLSWPVLDFRG